MINQLAGEWNQQAQTLYNNTTLGKRETQIAVLTAHGHQPETIHNKLQEHEENPPTIRTIESHQSKLRNKIGTTTTTHNLLSQALHQIKPPVYALNEHPTTKHPDKETLNNTTYHAYIGQIGTGKTITSQAHALQINRNQHTDHIIVYDYFEAWTDKTQYYDPIQTITPQQTPPQTQTNTQTILNTIKNQPTTNTITLFIDVHLPMILDEDPYFLDKLDELEHTISVRYQLQNWNPEFEKHTEPDMLHIHRSDCPHLQTYLNRLHNTSPLTMQPHNPTHAHKLPLNPPHVMTVNTQTNETTIRPNFLTQHEQNALLD